METVLIIFFIGLAISTIFDTSFTFTIIILTILASVLGFCSNQKEKVVTVIETIIEPEDIRKEIDKFFKENVIAQPKVKPKTPSKIMNGPAY